MRLFFVLFFAFACVLTQNGECKKRPLRTQGLSPVEVSAQVLLRDRQRTDLINYLILKNGYTTYLEIGLADGANFRAINVQHKVGVDPSPAAPATYQLTSDDFFASNQQTFDIVFIDGLHLSDQVLKDIDNSLKCLNPGGTIVMHDCLPQTEPQQGRTIIPGSWNGDVWKAAAYVRMHYDNVYFCVLDMDWGCGIITPNSSQVLFPARPIAQMDWNFFLQNRDALLNVKTVENWLQGM